MELRVVLGKHEVMCEFAGEPKLAELHTAVHKALSELDHTFPTFTMTMMPEGLLLSDDSSVAALSSGSTIEVVPESREIVLQLLRHRGFSGVSAHDLNPAMKRGDTETVRLMLIALECSETRDYTIVVNVIDAIRTAVVNEDVPMCRIMFSMCKSLMHSCRGSFDNLQLIDGLQSPEILPVLVESGVNCFVSRFYSRAAETMDSSTPR
eukprot:TRINITY_DN1153_c0_g1_i6.p1 TRINITY_DN1153_c0_g1~~TRINITY_DN1153_c0_g1_i6.p1  ORF type:complete len:224 (+),score=35.31 TRINITY_DN1153_c0_g1_i6:49-672(+)